ncbi:hypothetical protein LWI28_015232 [Acer negundo]|uniref:CSD domain-containing protein n=1 Tax=Acer negundo TaxID=4023 RepID=A0AAD5NNL6_ACENE|nr:hypothetical protein LWI28_015232 [Acer negundo]
MNFVHQFSIRSDSFRSLGEGEEVEFVIESDGSRTKAADVIGPNGNPVPGTSREGGRVVVEEAAEAVAVEVMVAVEIVGMEAVVVMEVGEEAEAAVVVEDMAAVVGVMEEAVVVVAAAVVTTVARVDTWLGIVLRAAAMVVE